MPNVHGFTYTAFISYSHVDEDVARWLHRRLESYEIPKTLHGRLSPVGPIPRRLGRFFRDRDELPAATGLSDRIRDALANSAHLIVICSPAAATSAWVDREIAEFRAMEREDQILAMNVAGEPSATIPPSLAPLDLVVADMREVADGRDHGFLKLVAGLIGVRLGELKDREAEAVRQRARRRTYVIGTLTALLILSLAGLAGTFLYAQKSRTLARESIETSGGIADDAMVMGLNARIPIAAIESFTNTALQRLDDLEAHGVGVPELRSRRAWLITRLSQISEMKGDPVAQERHANRAIALVRGSDLYADLLTLSAATASLATATSLRGSHVDALKQSQAAVELSRRAVRLYPDKYQTRLMLSETLMGLGDKRQANGDAAGALSAYSESVALFRLLLREHPDSASFPMRMADQLGSIGDLHMKRHELEKAVDSYREGVEMARRFLKWNAEQLPARQNVHELLLKLGYASSQTGNHAEMVRAYSDAVLVAREIARKHSDYEGADHDLAQTVAFLKQAADACAESGKLPLALAAFEACIAAEQELATRHPGVAAFVERRVVTLMLAVGVAVDTDDRAKARMHLDAAEKLLLTSDDWPENPRYRQLYQQIYSVRTMFLLGTSVASPEDYPRLPVVDE